MTAGCVADQQQWRASGGRQAGTVQPCRLVPASAGCHSLQPDIACARRVRRCRRLMPGPGSQALKVAHQRLRIKIEASAGTCCRSPDVSMVSTVAQKAQKNAPGAWIEGARWASSPGGTSQPPSRMLHTGAPRWSVQNYSGGAALRLCQLGYPRPIHSLPACRVLARPMQRPQSRPGSKAMHREWVHLRQVD